MIGTIKRTPMHLYNTPITHRVPESGLQVKLKKYHFHNTYNIPQKIYKTWHNYMQTCGLVTSGWDIKKITKLNTNMWTQYCLVMQWKKQLYTHISTQNNQQGSILTAGRRDCMFWLESAIVARYTKFLCSICWYLGRYIAISTGFKST